MGNRLEVSERLCGLEACACGATVVSVAAQGLERSSESSQIHLVARHLFA